jgi:hypothetical protein
VQNKRIDQKLEAEVKNLRDKKVLGELEQELLEVLYGEVAV